MSCNQCGNVTLPNGSNGLNGYNAFTVTTASFVLPAVGASVSILVSASGQYTGIWAILGQIVYISDGVDAEYFEVTTAGTQTTIGVKNLGYVGTAVGNTFGSGSKVSPAGLQGAGTNGSDGTTLLAVSHAAQTLAGLAYADFGGAAQATITAAQMDTNGDSVEIRAKFYLNAASASPQGNFRILVGNVTMSMFSSIEPALTKAYPYAELKVVVTRASATTANVRCDLLTSAFGFGSYASELVLANNAANMTYEILATGAITWANGNAIEIQGLVGDVSDTIKLGFYEIVSLKQV